MTALRGGAPEAADAAAVRIPPPLLFLAALILAALLQRYALPLPVPIDPLLRRGAALVTLVAGMAFMVGGIALFRRTGQAPEPWKSTPEIITTGVYRVTRNPMYLGMALVQTGIGLGRANGWTIVLVPLSMTLVHLTAIRHEEAYLERKFGRAYTDYKATVRRWI